MEDIVNLQKISLQAAKIIEPYLRKLLGIHPGNIISIVLSGAAAGKDYLPGISQINLLVVFNTLGFGELKKSLRLVSQGIRKKIAAPLFLTRQHIETSLDVFPIEFLEMKENHILLYGEDILSGLEINSEHIRLFCEEQVKGKLIRIRQAYLEIGLKRKGTEALLKESLSTLTPVLRNLIRLKGKVPPLKKEDIYSQLSAEFGLEQDVFLAILKDTANDEKINAQDVEVFFERYIAQIQKLAVAVDRL